MNHLNSIYQRLQSNYSDCDITYAPGLLTVTCKNGEIRADGFRTCFLEDGKTVQELLEKNDDDLYEEMERFILYLQEGGANLETESLPTESEESAEDAVSDTVKSPAGFSSNTAEPVKPSCKWPALLSGIVIILYSLLGLFMTLFYMGDTPSVGITLGIVMHVSILLAGIALLVCHAPKLPEHSHPVICIQERLFVSVLAFIVWPLALFLLLIAFGYCVQPPLDVPFGLIMFLIGLGLLICGIWMLLAGKNRRLYVFENGSLTYMTSWGRKRELLPGQRFSIRFGANDSIQFLNADKKKFFAIERNMRGVDKLADWIESREIPLEITKLKEQQIQQEEGIEPVIQWREEYTTRLHSHLKEIRLGKWLVLALFWAGSIIPLFFFIARTLKFSQTIYLMAASPLPFIVYYLAFAPVLTLNGKQKGATAEWQSHHIRISFLLVLLPALWLMSVFHYGLEHVLIMEEKWYTLAFWFGLGAIFIIAFVLRTPKRLRGEGLFMIGLSLLLVAEPMVYAGNFALCGEEIHYPAKVLERNIEQDDNDGSLEYSLTVQLDEGTAFEFPVTEELYEMEESGTEFVVCQRENPLGVRMLDLHLPPEK
ncbi:hypothetical protein [Mediterraneibacter gnavus]|uniref:hypothetical protein n=1 Tax=Mediterraneibacter gnavus TaxID=33038 RepID=UPI00232E0F4D|nr:hypothetical protein [Mediterraneibacter gnavus]MDB8711822.1 hypothetical protein [Mediterraneibacter gnavus]MDB8713544.1 hypothetical protein [Mediterraneibacter gnavus]